MAIFCDPERAKSYECAVCKSIYREATQIACGDHIFCKRCVQGLSITGSFSLNGELYFNCPLCRKACNCDHLTRVKFIDRQINQLLVKCPNSCVATDDEDSDESEQDESETEESEENNEEIESEKKVSGNKRKRPSDMNNNKNHKKRRLDDSDLCKWTGCYSDLSVHIHSCPFQTVSCGHCGLSMDRREVNDHYDKCPSFPIQCKQCKQSDIMRSDMDYHINNECPMTMIECKECKEKIKRCEEKKHLHDVCQEALIKCPFQRFGCKASIKRKDRDKHLMEDSVVHQLLMAAKVTKLESTVNKMQANEMKSRRRMKKMEAEIVALKRKCNENTNDSDESSDDYSDN